MKATMPARTARVMVRIFLLFWRTTWALLVVMASMASMATRADIVKKLVWLASVVLEVSMACEGLYWPPGFAPGFSALVG